MPLVKKTLLSEKSVFTILALLQLVPYFAISLIPSMDGPQHLHNSQVIVQLLKGNPVFQEFYIINPVLVGYWTGHFLLTAFNFIFPATLAESLMISTYLLGLAYSFRYLVVAINPKPSYLTVLIIPFSYTFYFLLGYYSFSLAFIFMFLAFGYYYKNRNNLGFKNLLVLFLLITGTFLSHGFVFALFGLGLVLFVLLEFLFDLSRNGKTTYQLIFHGKRAVLLFIVSLPAIILFIIYIRSVMGIDATVITERYEFNERLHFIIRIRAIIGFHMGRESYANYVYWIVMLVAINYVLHRFFVRMKLEALTRKQVWQEFFSTNYIWAHLSLAFLIIYFAIPDRISAGNLVSRIAVFVFYFLIVWVASLKLPKRLSGWLAAMVIIFFIHQAHYRVKTFYRLSVYGKDVQALEQYIEPNSILYPYRVSSHWVDLHFINYLGIDKPIINLGNPQCGGQFPVVWNYEHIPILMVGTRNVTDNYARNHSRSNNHEIRHVDYVAVYRWGEFNKAEGHEEFKAILEEYYELQQVSPKGHAALFKLK
ncbi:MAG: hypothetical protein ACOC0C_05900 [Bacteroidota bacterium]